jgi:hypothetical protein
MLRNTFLALAATASLIGGAELGNNTARADIHIRGPFGHVRLDIDCHCHRPLCRPAVIVAPPIVVAPAPVVVAPASPCFEVMIRANPAAAWQIQGTFPNLQGAEAAAAPLRSQGMEVMIRTR